MKTLLLCLPLALAGCCSKDDATHAADNTARNERDKSGHTVTPTDQLENEADRTVTQKARQAVVHDDTLSMDAKNIKIVTQSGVVTLRGVVDSSGEKSAIETAISAVPGVRQIDNQLEIKSK